MYIPVKTLNKIYYIEPYTTKLEKEALLISQLVDDKLLALDEVLRIFKFEDGNKTKISNLTLDEKKYLIYLYRSFSVGDIAKITFTCSGCSQISTNNLKIDTFSANEVIFDKTIRQLSYEPNEDNLNDFLTSQYKKKHKIDDVYDLDVDEFEAILKYVKSTQMHVNFNKKTKCSNCGIEQNVNCGDVAFILDNISEVSISSLYELYNNLVENGYSKLDIDSLIPFERGVLVQLMIASKTQK